jgi:hypothetical protein
MFLDQFGRKIESNKTEATKEQLHRSKVLTQQCFNPATYEYDFSFQSNSPDNFWGVHTTAEMMQCLENNPHIELDARIVGITADGMKSKRYDAASFMEASRKNDDLSFNFKEFDSFARGESGLQGGNFVGQDFTPLLGGPFYKNQYYYQDYIKMHSECFYAYHHDPIAKAIIAITRDFVLGTGFEVQCDTSDTTGQVAMATWKAFEEVNDLQQQMHDACNELGIYGENLIWWLPGNQTKITYNLAQGDKPPTGIIPRVRLLDPSNMIEIVTYPEDITRKLFYVWLTPTQYQIYTGSNAANDPKQPIQPTMKFIYQQIPADQILHFKVNSVSNEKRGRSDLFPVLSYLKRFRDSLNYSMIADQKASAWAIDTTVKGNQPDIDAYVQAQAALGTIPNAGSEFVHSDAITRQYLGNSNSGNKMSDSALYALSAICTGTQIPFNYLGTHLSGGSTKAAALVATEPVAKKMENRREVIKRVIKDLWKRLMKEAGIPISECNVIFPEIITQDRSQKLQDLALGEQQGWWSKQRAATVAAKEMGMSDYDFNTEQEKMKSDQPEMPAPLSSPGQAPSPPSPPQAGQSPKPVAALTSTDKKEIKKNDTTL